jgi:hypothetical protein
VRHRVQRLIGRHRQDERPAGAYGEGHSPSVLTAKLAPVTLDLRRGFSLFSAAAVYAR